MICQKCQNQLSEGTRFCNFCGSPVAEAPAQPALMPQPVPVPAPAQIHIPIDFTLDQGSGLYYKTAPGYDPATGAYGQNITWFYPGTGQYTQAFHPSAPAPAQAAAPVPQAAAAKSNGKFAAWMIAPPAAALLIGVAIAFFLAGGSSPPEDSGIPESDEIPAGIVIMDIGSANLPVVRSFDGADYGADFVQPPEEPPVETPVETGVVGTWSMLSWYGFSSEIAFSDDGRFYLFNYDMENPELIYVTEGRYVTAGNIIELMPEYIVYYNYYRNEIIKWFDSESDFSSATYFRDGDTLILTDADGELTTLFPAQPSGLWGFDHPPIYEMPFAPPPVQDAYIRGTVTAVGYYSEFFDLSFIVPEGYYMVMGAELDAWLGDGASAGDTGVEMMVNSITHTHNMIIMAANLDTSDVTVEQYIDILLSKTDTRNADVVVGRSYYFAGREFIDLSITAEDYVSSYLVRKVGNYMLTLIISSAPDYDSLAGSGFLLDTLQPFYAG